MTTEIEFIDAVRAVVIFDDGIRASRAILDLPGGAEEYVLLPAKGHSAVLNTVIVQQTGANERRDCGERSVEWIAALTGASVATGMSLLIFILSS